MSTLTTEIGPARAQDVSITEDTLTVDLEDGRTISVPLGWYPRLYHARQRSVRIGVGLGKEKGFIGPVWMKTSVLKVSYVLRYRE